MKYFRSLLYIPVILLIACGGQETEEETMDPNELIGTWELKSYVPSDNSDTSWTEYGPNIVYYKHITPSHFNWIHYDSETDQMNGIGGGLYSFNAGENEYIEDIEFFMPPGSNIVGQSIPFDAEFKEGKWYHNGYVREFELDPEIGEYVLTDSSIVKEIWEKVEDDGSNTRDEDINLVGTWLLVKHIQPGDSTWTEYPGFVGYVKHITPTHFGRVNYDAEGTEVRGAGGGRYTLEGNSYTEHIEYVYPKGSEQIGASFEFNIEMEDDQLHQTGYVYRIKDEGGEQVFYDSAYLQEVWEKYQ